MIPISVVIITKNEEKNIKRCLDSVSWADEIVVVDSGSTDATVYICNSYNAIVISSDWSGFAVNKQKAVDAASHNWVFSIDADEVVTDELRQSIQILLRDEPEIKGFRVKRTSFYLGKKINHCGWDRDFTLRLFDKRYGRYNSKIVHESVIIQGNIGVVKGELLHYTYPDLSSHFNKMRRYAELGAEEQVKKNNKSSIVEAIFRGIVKFLKMYFLQLGFLDGKHGFLLCFNSAWGVYLKYILIWEKNNKNKH